MTSEEQSILAVLQHLEQCWNTADSHGFATVFAEDATFIQIFGGQLDGRSAIEASHRAIFDTIYKGSRSRWELRSVRWIKPDVAVAFTQAHVDFFEGDQPRALDTRPTMVMVRTEGKWQIVAFQNTRIAPMPAAAQAASALAT
ncbi:MAG TPA: SgcJ/EcaC family oxidoreductase [Terriglobales bacterium]|nr:SgcJ/EcaC family oxidoreductase [Terriglobales bacterium]